MVLTMFLFPKLNAANFQMFGGPYAAYAFMALGCQKKTSHTPVTMTHLHFMIYDMDFYQELHSHF